MPQRISVPRNAIPQALADIAALTGRNATPDSRAAAAALQKAVRRAWSDDAAGRLGQVKRPRS